MNATRNLLTLVFAMVVILITENVRADFTFGRPAKVGPVINGSDWIDCFSSDGLEMYISSGRAGGQGSLDLWVLRRASVDEDWGPPQNLGPAVNGPQEDGWSSISADGMTLYFESNRPGGTGARDIYATTRATKNDPWDQAVNLGPKVNSGSTDCEPWISADGLELYFGSYRGGYGACDIWVTRRATTNDPWGQAVNAGPVVNSAYEEHYPSLSPDGLLLLFSDCHDCDSRPPRPGGYGGDDMWMARRASLSAPWQTPVNLGPMVNSSSNDAYPRISLDGRTLYFRCNGNNWQAPILPIVDFNGDGKVDVQDLLQLMESWDKDPAAVDIGPMPWGDGKVDERDLEVFMSYWGQEVTDPTLIACWKLDETSGVTAADSAGTNDGTLMGNPTWQPTGGKIKGALKFDGSPRFVMTKFVCDPSAGPFSTFAWVKGGAPGQVILSQGNGANWFMASTPNGALAGQGLTSSAIITDGAWHRIGFIWDGSSRILYVDGVEAARDVVASLAGSTGGLYIGAGMNLASGSFWSGLIDDVRIYNRIVKP